MATLRYILKFTIESKTGGKINSKLKKVNIVPNTEINESDFDMQDKKQLEAFLKKNNGVTNYYFLPDDLKGNVCNIVGQIDNNANIFSLGITGKYSMKDSYENKGESVNIEFSETGAKPTITIIDDTSVNVGSDLYNLDNGAIIKANVGGGKPKGGRTKRRKYRKKRKSKSSRKSRRKTAKK